MIPSSCCLLSGLQGDHLVQESTITIHNLAKCDAMCHPLGNRGTIITYSACMSVCEKAQQWQLLGSTRHQVEQWQ